MDDAIGRLIAALEKTGARRNTLIIFTSDNGAMGGPAADLAMYPGEYENGQLGDNKPLRGHKTQVYEGGIRVPAFANWPGRISPRKVDAAIGIVDWLPTLAKLAAFQPDRDPKWDGIDVWPLLTAQSRPSPRDLYWEGPGGRSFAVRSGDWKLVVHNASAESRQRTELFNLRDDPYEKRDRAAAEPSTVAHLNKLLTRHRSLDDAVPARVSPTAA
jgi:arylsulfatase A-like enzyme